MGIVVPAVPRRVPLLRNDRTKYQDRVAFIGLDANDARDAAQQFLNEVPPGFPSIFDPGSEATASLGGGRISPTTFFLDAKGERVSTRLGAYADAAQLEQDVRGLLAKR